MRATDDVMFVLNQMPTYRRPVVELVSSAVKASWVYSGREQDGVRSAALGGDAAVRVREASLLGCRWQVGVLTRVIRQRPPLIVMTGDARYLSTWLVLVVARLLGVRIALWSHGWLRPDSGLRRRVKMIFYGLASELWVYSERGRTLATQMGYPAERVRVLQNSQDQPVVEVEGRRRNPAAEATLRWIVISRLLPRRRIDIALEAAKICADRGSPIELAIIGDGPERSGLEQLAGTLGVSAQFLGAVYEQETTLQWLTWADVAVYPSGAGLGVVHALSVGCPVAVSREPGENFPEWEAVIPGATGLRFDGTAESLASSMMKFFAGRDMASVATACREEVSLRWSPDVQAARILEGILALGRDRA